MQKRRIEWHMTLCPSVVCKNGFRLYFNWLFTVHCTASEYREIYGGSCEVQSICPCYLAPLSMSYLLLTSQTSSNWGWWQRETRWLCSRVFCATVMRWLITTGKNPSPSELTLQTTLLSLCVLLSQDVCQIVLTSASEQQRHDGSKKPSSCVWSPSSKQVAKKKIYIF